jgi:HTH-type transcriptional regulator/antitoxin HigA
MAEQVLNQYEPDYAVSPGEVLEDYLDSFGMTQAELATRLGFSKKTINEIIKGKAPIVPDTALKLERVFSRPAHFWNNLEQRYQEDRARLIEQERLREHLDWLNRVPVKQMVERGFIQKFKDKTEQLNEVLRFFGVAFPEQWRSVWEQHQVAYRQSQRFEPCAEAVSAWLRQGEIQAQQIDCAPYDKQRFQQTLHDIRLLTREPPEVFQPSLIELCASCGVAVVFVPDLPKTGVSGATRWLGNKAVIQLSLRYKSNDQLWFTFFHEAGHILKHGRKEIFLEGNGMDGEKEEEANQFARDFLIPPKAYREFISHSGLTLAEVSHFANAIDVAPGVVVGRLQFEKLLAPHIGNKLKVFYRWVNG